MDTRDPGGTVDEPRVEEARKHRKRQRWWPRLLKTVARVVLGVVGVAVMVFFFLTRSHPGQVWVVDRVLARLEGRVDGTIRVGDVRSGDLMERVRLYDVSIVDPGGEPFLQVDSLRAGYSLAELLAGRFAFSDVELFGPSVRIRTRPEGAPSNVAVIFGGEGSSEAEPVSAPAAPPDSMAGPPMGDTGAVAGRDSTTSAGPEIVLREVRIVGGALEILQPLEGAPPERAVVVEGPDGERLRSISVQGIHGELSRALLSSPTTDGVRFTVASLGLEARIFREPARVEDLRGVATWADGTLTVEAAELKLPGSDLEGTIRADLSGTGGPRFLLDLEASPVDLADVRWAEPRIPEGTLTGGVRLDLGPDGMDWRFSDARGELGSDRVRADGRVDMRGAAVRFGGLDLRLAPLDVDRLRPWTTVALPLEGRLRGDITLDGPLTAVRTDGTLTLVPPGGEDAATTVELHGVLRAGSDPGADSLTATFDPLDYGTLAAVVDDSLTLGGRGSATVEATGTLSEGIRFTAGLIHRAPGLPTSRLTTRGSLQRQGERLLVDVQGDVSPLSFTALRSYLEGLPVTGEVSGSVHARGPLSDLTVTTALDTEAGRMDLEARLNARRPAEGYRVRGEIDGVPLSRFVPGLGEPSVVSAAIRVEGSGLSPDSARAEGTLRLKPSTLAGVPVDTATLDFHVADGTLALDTLEATALGVAIRAGGRIPFRPGEEEGVVRLGFVGDSLDGLRSLVERESPIARDTLAVGGRVEGSLVVRGSLQDFRAEGDAVLSEGVWGQDRVEGARLDFAATGLPGLAGRMQVTLAVDSLVVLDRHFAAASLEVDYTRPRGSVEIVLARSDAEDYRARAVAEVDSLGGRVDLQELALRFDSLTWSLSEPATVSWDDRAVRIGDLVVTRPGPEPTRIRATGTLPRRGEADFTLDVDGLDLSRVTGLLQREDLDLQGIMDLTVGIGGTAASPVIHGDVRARDVSYATWNLDRILGSLDYRDRHTAVDFRAWRDDLQVLVATGIVPVDLSLSDVAERIPEDRQMDVRVVADSLPAAFAVTLLENLEDVEGTVAGDFRIGGTVKAPSPTGTLTIQDAAWTLAALGVRQNDVQGTLTLTPDGTMDVDARARSGGTAQVTGTVGLEPLSDPTFDLVLSFDAFRAIDRRDMEGQVSGQVTLTGSLSRPLVEGLDPRGLSARGILHVEEFERSATVVDLSDPRFAEFVGDEFLSGAQPIIAASRNPFLDRLRVDVDLTVERDTWLRSRDMNVEIAGNLRMNYAREQRDLVLSGTLQAIRGSYTQFGRRFEVQGGTVEFVGTPGVNPDLSIQATSRVRRPDGEPLNITATLSGTLSEPRVQLNSDEEALAQSDLVSYLVFGRPSYELTSGQAQGVQEAAQSSLASVGVGTLTSQISSLLGQRFGLDYFAINPGGLPSNEAAAAFRQTTVELGGYLGQDLFWVLTLRPLGFEGANTLSTLPGVRLEWQPGDIYKVEAFVDDRFLRSGSAGLRELSFQPERVFGLNIVREWTY